MRLKILSKIVISIPLLVILDCKSVSSNGEIVIELIKCLKLYSPPIETIPLSSNLYNESRIGNNFRYDNYYPLSIISVTSVDDIIAGVLCAKKFEVPIGAMNGGHSFEGMSCTSGLLFHMDEFSNLLAYHTSIVNYSNSRKVSNGEADDSFIEIQSGAGTCPTVGVTGHVLCGGFGYFGRLLGFTSDQIISFTVINFDGKLIHVSNEENIDLFWALRGSCSSSFGIIASIRFKLNRLSYNKLTLIDLPSISFSYNNTEPVIRTAFWWQTWASAEAPYELTSILNFDKTDIHIKSLFIGTKEEAIKLSLNGIAKGLEGILPISNITKSYYEVSFFEAMQWWTDDSSLQSNDDYLAIKSWPLLTHRTSRRKSKSALAFQPISTDAIERLINYRLNGGVNQIEWKAYGGNSGIVVSHNDYNKRSEIFSKMNHIFSDDKSPLLRGKLFEMHYGNSRTSSGDVSSDQANDKILVEHINAIGKNISLDFNGTFGYIGYIDYDLENPGMDYFGSDNTQKLSSIRQKFDPNGVFETKGSGAYPNNMIISNKISSLNNNMKFIYVANGVSSVLSINDNNNNKKDSKPIAEFGSLNEIIQTIKFVDDLTATNCNVSYLHQVVIHDDYDGNTDHEQRYYIIEDNNNLCLIRRFFIVDRNNDMIYEFQIDIVTGFIIRSTFSKTLLPKGSGPRHLAFHPNNKFVYLVSESV
eukprot:gene12336-16545_t